MEFDLEEEYISLKMILHIKVNGKMEFHMELERFLSKMKVNTLVIGLLEKNQVWVVTNLMMVKIIMVNGFQTNDPIKAVMNGELEKSFKGNLKKTKFYLEILFDLMEEN